MILYIVRGLPGSGVSTKAKELMGTNAESLVEIDDFFNVAGHFKFFPYLLNNAHEWAYFQIQERFKMGFSKVVLAHIFSRKMEMRNYIDLARQYGYKVEIIEPDTAWAKDIDECFNRTKRPIDKNLLVKLNNQWETI